MRYNKRIKTILSISVVPLFFCVCFLSFLQVKFRDSVAIAIANNVAVCMFTGAIIACIQAVVGYVASKYDCILAFYKDAIMLENIIIHYPYKQHGFIEAHRGLEEVREIISLFDEQFKYSYLQIVFPNRKKLLFEAIKTLYLSYSKHIKAYKEFDSDLCDAIRFSEVSDDTLAREEITDIDVETSAVNQRLQAKADEICDIYNDEKEQHIRVAAYEVIERYLFKQREKKK